MMKRLSEFRKNKIKKAAHAIAGGVTLIHALERYEAGHQTYIIFVLAGVTFIGVGLFHHRLQRSFPWIDRFFLVLEGILSFVICWEYFHADKTYLPWMYVFAGTLQVFSALFLSSRALGSSQKT